MANAALFGLTGKVALTTGASKGMGKAMAAAMAQQGAKVVVSSRKQEACATAAAEINESCGEERAVAFACNAGHKDQLQALVSFARRKLGPIDILLSNAGVNPFRGAMGDMPDWAYDKVMNTNVKSNHWLARMVAPDMARKGSGSMIFISSIAALGPDPEMAVYAMSKTAVLALARNLAADLGPHGIRVNCICPGVIKTDFARALWDDPEAEKSEAAKSALRRLGHPDDLKGVAVFLASDASGYMTGQALNVCGGTIMCR